MDPVGYSLEEVGAIDKSTPTQYSHLHKESEREREEGYNFL